MNRMTNKFHRDFQHPTKKEINKMTNFLQHSNDKFKHGKKDFQEITKQQKTKEQLKKDIQELWNRHAVIIENIKTLRQSLEIQSTHLEYGATEIKLLEAELRELNGES